MSLNVKLKNLIENSGLTMSEISTKTDIPNSTLSGILNGKFKNVSIQRLKLICDVLDCSLDYLLDDNVTDVHYGLRNKPTDTYQSKLLSTFNKLNSEYKELVIQQVNTILEFQNSKDKS